MHNRRMLCSSSTTRRRIRESPLVTSALLRQKSIALRIFPRGGLHTNSYLRRCTRGADGGGWQTDQKRAPFRIRIVAAENLTVMRLDDPITDAEAQSRSLP